MDFIEPLFAHTSCFPASPAVGRSSFRASPAVATQTNAKSSSASRTQLSMSATVDLKGKVAFIAGVADSTGYGWAIAKALADAGATIIVGTWPPVLKIFEMGLKKGQFDDDSILSDGSKMVIEKVYPLDAVFDVPEDVPAEIKENKRYAGLDGYTIEEVAKAVEGRLRKDRYPRSLTCQRT